ncbi:MAG: hypothetical protein ACI8X5_001909 [Planctomycetota bacterium]|jgi:hypothetical protein
MRRSSCGRACHVPALSPIHKRSASDMNATNKQSQKKTRRGLSLGVLLLVLIHITQPALAFLGAAKNGCSGFEVDCCCSVDGVPQQAALQSSCCEEGQTDSEEDHLLPLEGDCDCRTIPLPIPSQDPLLPPERTEGLRENALSHWVRVHAESFANQLWGPPGASCAAGFESGVHRYPRVSEVNVGPLESHEWGARAWVLLVRGVSGLLAVLSVVRL